MTKNLTQFLIAILLISTLSSCSGDKKIDDKNAVSVFLKDDSIKVDPALEKIQISIPVQTSSKSWFGSNNDNNAEVENFRFPKEITKIKSNWENYRFSYPDHHVFAPLIADEKIYHLDVKGNLYAKNLDDLKLIWKKKLVNSWFTKDFTNGKISYHNNQIFVSTGYNFIFCVNAQTGDVVWEKKLSSIPISTPIADDKQVYVITDDNKTYALNVQNGEINWTHAGILRATGIMGSASPVVYKNNVISSYSSGEIYALNKDTGEANWVHDLNINKADNSDFILNDVDATPVAKDGVVYGIGNGGLMMSIRVADGVILWQKELASITDFWIAGEFIYLINNDNQLISVYRKTGGIKWFVQLKKYFNEKKTNSKIIYNGIVMAGDNLIFTNSGRRLFVVSPVNGEILQTKKINGKIFHNPIVVNEKIYLQTIDSFVTSLVVIK